MKILSILSMCLTSLVLLAYPLVLMANVMAISGLPAAGPLPSGTTFCLKGYFWGSTLYPLPWLASLVGSIWCLKKGNGKKALLWQAALIGYLILTAALLLSS